MQSRLEGPGMMPGSTALAEGASARGGPAPESDRVTAGREQDPARDTQRKPMRGAGTAPDSGRDPRRDAQRMQSAPLARKACRAARFDPSPALPSRGHQPSAGGKAPRTSDGGYRTTDTRRGVTPHRRRWPAAPAGAAARRHRNSAGAPDGSCARSFLRSATDLAAAVESTTPSHP